MSIDSNQVLNFLMSALLGKITVPTNYHERVIAVKTMLEDDVSGLVDSLTDFMVDSASVNYTVETDNPKVTQILKKWLDNINAGYKGQIPRGIDALAEEYSKERWKSSSFPILKISEWDTVDGISVPTKMFFVDGESIRAEDKNAKEQTKTLFSYDYYLGKGGEDPLKKGVIITKPYGRWFDKYPNPYLIKRGVYHNWKIVQSLKNKQTEILDRVIPYLLLVKKGSEGLEREGKTYSDEQLKTIGNQLQELLTNMKTIDGTPTRTTNFDEELKHLIPDLEVIFKRELFTVAERGILSGLGFIDVVEATSTSRRESILNPKAFIEETKKGVKDFKRHIINELVARIIEENQKEHRKLMSEKINYYIVSSPVKGFMTDAFKNHLRLQWERGQLSNQTYCELVGEVEFRTEVARREKEAKDGTEITMYPHQTQNNEKDESFEEIKRQQKFYKEEKDTDKNGNPIPQDKLTDKDKYDIGKLETAPYTRISELPASIRKVLSPSLQNVFLRVWNKAYKQYKNETRAFRVAWSVIRRIGRKGKDGKWHRKNTKGKRTNLTKSMIEDIEKIIEE